MVSAKVLTLRVFFVALAMISAGEALQCYECKGEPDSDCAKAVVSAMKVVECPSGGGLAMCQSTDTRNGAIRSFSRGCTKFSIPDLCTLLYQLSAQNPIALKVFSCDTCFDAKCNIHTTKSLN